MGTRHWPDDANDEVERLEQQLAAQKMARDELREIIAARDEEIEELKAVIRRNEMT